MKHFAGLDVSLEEIAICVIDEAGAMVKEARVPSEPEALVAFFQRAPRESAPLGSTGG